MSKSITEFIRRGNNTYKTGAYVSVLNIKAHLAELSSEIEANLEIVSRKYRKNDPGRYLYRLFFQGHYNNDVFAEESLELIYVTLVAWGMRSRGASLSEFEKFKESVLENESSIKSLKGLRIESISEGDCKDLLGELKSLFDKLELTKPDKPKLVTFSKAMHFLLPNLVVPMDRKYTMKYFLDYTTFSGNNEKMFELYKSIYIEFVTFSREHPELSKFLNNDWNQTIPKIMDNLIIGHILKNPEEKENL